MSIPLPDGAKLIDGYDCYSVTPDGTVYSNKRGEWMVKKHIIGKTGYPVVSFSRNGKNDTRYVHRLVLEAFVGPAPDQHECLHADGNRLNPRLENLRWGTRSENMADAKRHGTDTTGVRNGAAKLRGTDPGFMRDMHDMGFSVEEIQRHWPISKTTIKRVIARETYKED